MAITGMYTGGIQVGGGYYRDGNGNFYNIGGGYARTTDGRVILLAQPHKAISSGTILATIGKGLGIPSSYWGNKIPNSDLLTNDPVILSQPINSEKDIPNGLEISFDPTKSVILFNTVSTTESVPGNMPADGKFVFTYDELINGKVYHDGRKGTQPSDYNAGLYPTSLSVKLTSPTKLEFQMQVYDPSSGAFVPMPDTITIGTMSAYGSQVTQILTWLIPIAVTVE